VTGRAIAGGVLLSALVVIEWRFAKGDLGLHPIS
jgi:hypothetical protein